MEFGTKYIWYDTGKVIQLLLEKLRAGGANAHTVKNPTGGPPHLWVFPQIL